MLQAIGQSSSAPLFKITFSRFSSVEAHFRIKSDNFSYVNYIVHLSINYMIAPLAKQEGRGLQPLPYSSALRRMERRAQQLKPVLSEGRRRVF